MSDKTNKKRKGAKAGTTNEKKQRQAEQGADEEQKQAEPTVVPPLPIGRLYRHALQSIFKFCGLKELSSAMAVSRGWSAEVVRLPCAQLSARCRPASLVSLSSCALSAHVTTITHPMWPDNRCVLTSADLYLLALRVPQLTTLDCELMQGPVNKVILPHQLTTLGLNLSKLAAAAINTAIKAISQLNALVKLKLDLPSFLSAISFAALAAVASLLDLSLKSELTDSYPTDAQVDELGALPQLSSINVIRLSCQSLLRLLRSPHSAGLRDIRLLKGVDAAASAALSSLPNLTSLHTEHCVDIGFLGTLGPQLRTLDLNVNSNWPDTITTDAVVDGLSCCTQLTDLTLTVPLNSSLSVLLPRLPLLTKLCFWRMRELRSLECLSRGPVVHKLRFLKIAYCRHTGLILTELVHVHALTALEELTIENSFSEPFSSLDLLMHTPPSRAPKAAEVHLHQAGVSEGPRPPSADAALTHSHLRALAEDLNPQVPRLIGIG